MQFAEKFKVSMGTLLNISRKYQCVSSPWIKQLFFGKVYRWLLLNILPHDLNCNDYFVWVIRLFLFCRCCEASSMLFSNEDPELLLVKETPAMDDNNTMASPGSLSKDGNSSSTIFQASTQSPDQLSVHSQSLTNPVRVPSSAQPEMVVTPEKEVTGDTSNLPPERDSSLSSSVNSHTQKRRKTMVSPSVDLMLMASREANRRIEFNSETNYVKNKSKMSNNCAESHLSSTPVMDETLQISCSLCRSPLGLPENHRYVRCSVTSSAKAHLVSLLKQRQELCANVTSIPVIMTDISSVDQLLTNQSFGGASGQGIWCEEDGCVYNTLFCPFCSSPSNCLGVQIVASNALNFQLLNKVGFMQNLIVFAICHVMGSFSNFALCVDIVLLGSSGN